MNHEHGKFRLREGPPRYFLPICVQTSLGFVGGPSGYQEVGEDERDREVLVVETEKRQEDHG